MYSEVNQMSQSFWPGMVRDGDVWHSCPVLKKKSPEIHGKFSNLVSLAETGHNLSASFGSLKNKYFNNNFYML